MTDVSVQAHAEAQTRRRLGQLFLLYITVWILEGALRKWVAPSVQQPLYFLRVPVVLGMAYLAVRLRRPPLPVAVAVAGLAIAGLVTFSVFHVVAGDQSLPSAGLGVRLYIESWLVPLCVAGSLEAEQIKRAVRLIVLTIPPLAVLAFLQATSPITAPVNRIFQADSSDVYTTVDGVVRPAGTFTSSLGFSSYLVLGVAAVLSLAMDSPDRRDKLLNYIAAPCVGLMVLISGSRSALLGACVPLIVVLIVQLIRKPSRGLRLAVGLSTVAVLSYRYAPVLAPGAVEGLRTRTQDAGLTLVGRSFAGLSTWTSFLPQGNAWGHGLGAFAGGLVNLGGRLQVEDELSRWLLELGLPLFFIALVTRLVMCGVLIHTASAAMRMQNRTMPLVVVIAALPTLLTGFVTSQGSVNGFAAVAAGLVLAARRRERASSSAPLRKDGTFADDAQTTMFVSRRRAQPSS